MIQKLNNNSIITAMAMYFAQREKCIKSCNIEFVSSHNHLFLPSYENLRLATYIDNIIAKIHQKFNLVYKQRYKLLHIYRSSIRSHLNYIYASEVWSGCSLAESEKLVNEQIGYQYKFPETRGIVSLKIVQFFLPFVLDVVMIIILNYRSPFLRREV